MLSDRDKTAMREALLKTRAYLLEDAINARGAELVELVCDAGRPVTIGGMERHIYSLLESHYPTADTQKWLLKLLG